MQLFGSTEICMWQNDKTGMGTKTFKWNYSPANKPHLYNELELRCVEGGKLNGHYCRLK